MYCMSDGSMPSDDCQYCQEGCGTEWFRVEQSWGGAWDWALIEINLRLLLPSVEIYNWTLMPPVVFIRLEGPAGFCLRQRMQSRNNNLKNLGLCSQTMCSTMHKKFLSLWATHKTFLSLWALGTWPCFECQWDRVQHTKPWHWRYLDISVVWMSTAFLCHH